MIAPLLMVHWATKVTGLVTVVRGILEIIVGYRGYGVSGDGNSGIRHGIDVDTLSSASKSSSMSSTHYLYHF